MTCACVDSFRAARAFHFARREFDSALKGRTVEERFPEDNGPMPRALGSAVYRVHKRFDSGARKLQRKIMPGVLIIRHEGQKLIQKSRVSFTMFH